MTDIDPVALARLDADIRQLGWVASDVTDHPDDATALGRLLSAVDAVLDAHRAVEALAITQRAVDNAVAEAFALADSWHDDDEPDEPTAFREWQRDVIA